MYVWNVTMETIWNYELEDDEKTLELYCISADNFNIALKKAENLSLSKSRWFKDEEDEGLGKGFVNKPISTELISIERGDWLDG